MILNLKWLVFLFVFKSCLWQEKNPTDTTNCHFVTSLLESSSSPDLYITAISYDTITINEQSNCTHVGLNVLRFPSFHFSGLYKVPGASKDIGMYWETKCYISFHAISLCFVCTFILSGDDYRRHVQHAPMSFHLYGPRWRLEQKKWKRNFEFCDCAVFRFCQTICKSEWNKFGNFYFLPGPRHFGEIAVTFIDRPSTSKRRRLPRFWPEMQGLLSNRYSDMHTPFFSLFMHLLSSSFLDTRIKKKKGGERRRWKEWLICSQPAVFFLEHFFGQVHPREVSRSTQQPMLTAYEEKGFWKKLIIPLQFLFPPLENSTQN